MASFVLVNDVRGAVESDALFCLRCWLPEFYIRANSKGDFTAKVTVSIPAYKKRSMYLNRTYLRRASKKNDALNLAGVAAYEDFLSWPLSASEKRAKDEKLALEAENLRKQKLAESRRRNQIRLRSVSPRFHQPPVGENLLNPEAFKKRQMVKKRKIGG